MQQTVANFGDRQDLPIFQDFGKLPPIEYSLACFLSMDGEDEWLDMKKPMCAGNTVEQNRTTDVHNLSERVSLKSDTVCGNTQNSPLLFFVFWKPINAFMSISMASACMFCLASRTQYLLCYGGFVFHYSCGQVEIGI
jgi:hypothetical protein